LSVQVWADLYGLPVAGCDGKTAAQVFEAAGCDAPASPSCAACLGGPKDTYARMNTPQVCVSTTNRCAHMAHLPAWWQCATSIDLADRAHMVSMSCTTCTCVLLPAMPFLPAMRPANTFYK
jgi:hypothetical protein